MSEKHLIGAVDIGGTKIAVGIVNELGQILAQRETPTQAQAGFPAAMLRIEALMRECQGDLGRPLSGIGIGCTGPVDPFTGEIGEVDFLPGWKGYNPVLDLSQRFQLTVAMENDADAMALGEGFWGTGRGQSTLLCVTVGTGIGGGIIVDGKLYRGAGKSHPEVGHHVIDPSGPKCFCGASGCWEVLARGPAMTEWAEKEAPADYPHRSDLSAKQLCELSTTGDAFARRVIEREAFYLGLGLANLVTLFSPEMIVLGGSVMRSAHLFLPGIRSMIRQNCGLVPFEQTKITLASLGQNAPMIGAARVWHHRFNEIGG